MDEDMLQKQAKQAKKWNTIIFLVLTTLIIASIVCLVTFKYQHTFTVEKWIKSPENRVKIIDDLLVTHKLIGMTEKEIILLLGEEDSYDNTKTSFKINRTYFEPANTIVYYLGVEYIDSMWLIISFEKGRWTLLFLFRW